MISRLMVDAVNGDTSRVLEVPKHCCLVFVVPDNLQRQKSQHRRLYLKSVAYLKVCGRLHLSSSAKI
jgi:hypothetical protein